MPKILIVGAGQSGLQLALTLQAHDFDVTVMSAKTPAEIRNGRPTSTQCMFQPALQIERDLGLNLWEAQCPNLTAQRYNLAMPPSGHPDTLPDARPTPAWAREVAAPYDRAIAFTGPWKWPTQSVDQRIKMSGWLELFADRGGTVVYQGVMTSDLDGLAALGRYDLIVVAAGKGELVALFDRDPSRSPYDRPQRFLSCIYTRGMTWAPEYQDYAVSFANIGGVGEFFRMPGLTIDGPDQTQPCDILLFEGFPDGPLGPDAWSDRPGPDEHLRRMVRAMQEYVPWEYECARDIEISDARPSLMGSYTPTVRHPIGRLPSGGIVLGMGDVVVANDPVTGQGSNNAAHSADIYARHIIAGGAGPYDQAWMQETFDDYWGYAGPVTNFTNGMLAREAPEHVQRVLAAAQQGHLAGKPVVAERIAHGYTTPADLDWMMDPELTNAYLAEVAPDFAAPA